MTCRQGAMPTKLPLPKMPYTWVNSYLLAITCYPPHPTPVSQVAGARWQQIESVQLEFATDYLGEILRTPPIPWRANLDAFCHCDEVLYIDYPYPILSSTNRPEPEKAEAFCHGDDHPATPCGISASFGGTTYQRNIKLALEREGVEWCYWHIVLTITSRDVEWLASLSRADAAALVSLDSVAR
jgi:hypothetical protein